MSFVSTETLCNQYEVEKDFFLRRKKSEEFIKNIHYVQKGNTLRWDFERIKSWWKGEDLNMKKVDSILNKIIP